MIVLLALSGALASDADLERGRRFLAEGRPGHAAEELRRAVVEAPDRLDTWIAWLDACTVTGIGVGCRAEAALLEDAHPVVATALAWNDRVMARTRFEPDEVPENLAAVDRGALEGPDRAFSRRAQLSAMAKSKPDDSAALALGFLSEDPDHPEVLVPLLADDVPARKSVGKAKKKVLKKGRKALASAEVPLAYRWHEVFVAAGQAIESADRLEALGEPRPLARYPFTRAEQVQAARLLLEADALAFPTRVPAEREAIVLKVAELQASTGRAERLKATFEAGRASHDTVSLALEHGRLLLGLDDLEGARKVADTALQLAVEPWPTDTATTNRISRREALAQALVLLGRIELAEENVAEASVVLIVANQLSSRPIGTDALEKSMKTGRYLLEEVKARLETPARPAHEIALETASKALEEERFDDVDASARDAIAALCVPSHSKARLTARLAGRGSLASAYALRALAASKSGDADEAQALITIATLLVPWDSPADWWALRAEVAEESGFDEAGFFARAMASSLDEERSLPAVELFPHGTGEGAAAALVAEWMRGHEELEPPKDRLVIQRGSVIPFWAPGTGGGGGGGGGGSPALNAPFPSWSIETEHGTVGPTAGRIHLVTFFRSDSPGSIRALDELTSLARNMRGQGGNIVLVGISMDPEESALDSVRGKMERWGPVGWDPGMAQRFGVSAVPTTWVVDSDGIARFKHVGYLGTSEYEAEIRFISGL